MDKFVRIINEMPITGTERTETSVYSYSLDELEKMFIQIPSSKPKPITDTIARIFGKTRDENFISDWLAYLIGNDNQVLELLFEHFDFGESVSDFSVVREYLFNDGRRIDFLIESDSFIVGIENKVDSGKQQNQLRDYQRNIKKLAKGRAILLVFLKPYNNSSVASNGFVGLDYEELVSILKRSEVNFINDLRNAFLLQDFITHLEENLMSKNKDYSYNEWTAFIGEHQDKLDTIIKAGKVERVNFMAQIHKEIHSLVEYSDEWDFSKFTANVNFLQLFKKTWKQSVDIHFELFIKNGLYLPEKVVIRVDVEGRVRKDEKETAARFLGFRTLINEVSEIIIFDYSTQETLNESIEELKRQFLVIIEKYTKLIDDWYEEH